MSGMPVLKYIKGFYYKNLNLINSLICNTQIKIDNYCFCERNSLSGSIMDTSGFLPPPVNDIIGLKA